MKVTHCYKTSDGKLFEALIPAEKHQALLRLEQQFEKEQPSLETFREWIAWFKKHPKLVKNVFGDFQLFG